MLHLVNYLSLEESFVNNKQIAAIELALYNKKRNGLGATAWYEILRLETQDLHFPC